MGPHEAFLAFFLHPYMYSRHRLKESIAELVVSVPTLRNEKNPTRAVIIKKANEFVQASKRANDRLTEENTAYREQIAQLQMYGTCVYAL